MSGESPRAEHEYEASLRVFSTTRSLADLVVFLGDPSDGHDVGDPVSARLPGQVRTQSRWALESTVGKTRRLEEHVEELVRFVERHAAAFERLRPSCGIDLFCAVFGSDNINGGFVLEPELSGRLHELQLPLIVEVY
jgi:hypothetical protein